MKQSILTKSQSKKVTKKIRYHGEECEITCTIRYDDSCGNGHNSFAITGDITALKGRDRYRTGGCIHGEIEKHFPEFAHLIRWHFMSSDGPMHYIANTCYHASDKYCCGLAKGEKRQLIDRTTGLPAWELVAIDKATGEELPTYKMQNHKDSLTMPDCPYELVYRPWCRVGEGKERDFAAARNCSIWPDATDEQLSLDKEHLTKCLEDRLPGLIKEFIKDIEAIGFIF